VLGLNDGWYDSNVTQGNENSTAVGAHGCFNEWLNASDRLPDVRIGQGNANGGMCWI
jgi:hypothetical protein